MRPKLVGPAVSSAVGLALLYFSPALAQNGQPYEGPSQPSPQQSNAGAAQVNAEGNAFAGGLRFNPASVSIEVGGSVRWTNTDQFVPHTATESHNLWRLTGDYGRTPANPPGFGPGESRERRFEAGTHQYFCEVHPAQMKGTVAVPVTLGKTTLRRGGRRVRAVKAIWAPGAPAEGQVYDVEVRKGGRGAWKRFRPGTRDAQGSFRSGKKRTRWDARARLRSTADASAATDWSPEASITR